MFLVFIEFVIKGNPKRRHHNWHQRFDPIGVQGKAITIRCILFKVI